MTQGQGLALALLLGIAAAGCSKSPKPKVEVPTAAADTLARPAEKDSNLASPAPAPPAPRKASKPAAPPPAPVPDVGGVQTGSSTSSPAVVPQLSVAEQERLEKEVKAAIEEAQKEIGAIDSTKLDAERSRKYLIAKDFLVQAGSARTRKEYERAQALAIKAKLLAEEIAPR